MKKGTEPAFPCETFTEIGSIKHGGISTRLYLAGMAMQGILSNATTMQEFTRAYNTKNGGDFGKTIASAALYYTDALIEFEEQSKNED